MPYTLFLSHNASDNAIVREIKTRCQAAGVSVYTYEDDVRAGANIVEKLKSAISRCDGLVAILTRHGATRPAIQQEIGVAVGLGKPVYPLVEDGVDAATLTLLQGIEYIRLDLERFGDALLALQQSITRQREIEESAQIATERDRLEAQRNALLAAVALLLAVVVIVYLANKEKT
jgi:nucleoside 2-deoxyribosyltransferase